MAGTYAKITNAAEIYKDGIEKYWIVQIPKSKYSIVSRCNAETKDWTMWVLDLMATKKYLIEKNITGEKIEACIYDIVLGAMNQNKTKPKLRIIKMRLNNLIK